MAEAALAVGQVGDTMGLFCFTRDGRVDTSVGVGAHGSVRFDVGGAMAATVVVDARERIVVVDEAERDIAVPRLVVGGALDSSFGVGGKISAVNTGTRLESASSRDSQ